MIGDVWVVINGGAIFYTVSPGKAKMLASGKDAKFIPYNQQNFNFGFGFIHKNLIPYLNGYYDNKYYENFERLKVENRFFNFRFSNNKVQNRINNLDYLKDGIYTLENSRTQNVKKLCDLPEFKPKPYDLADKIILQLENLITENKLLKQELAGIYKYLNSLSNTLATTPLAGNGAMGYPSLSKDAVTFTKKEQELNKNYANIILDNEKLLTRFKIE